MRFTSTVLACVAVMLAVPALAQAPAPAPAPEPQATEPAPSAAPAKKVVKRKGPPASITVINASAHTATQVVITGEDKPATLSKPLAPKARAAVKLPKLKGCLVSVAATFESEGQVDAGQFNICKEKSIRFTD